MPINSFIRAQNEDIVEWLLRTDSRARLLPAVVPGAPAVDGQLAGTLRFDPVHSRTSGLFIARLTKAPDAGQGSPTRPSE